MKLEEIYKSESPVITFEVFPPKKETSIDELFEHLSVLKRFNPALISVTYGAGGSSRDKSSEIVSRIKSQLGITPMPHFTCVCSSRDFIKDYLMRTEAEGIENILALRGDEPQEIDVCYRDFRYANELVEFIRSQTSLSIAVAAYPECHMDCGDISVDIENLKRKVDAGASVIYTQLFFENGYFFRFMDLLEKASVNIPVVPGVLPVSGYAQLQRMTGMCGARVPDEVDKFFSRYKDDEESIRKAGTEFAIRQSQELLAFGIKGLHFYTLNKSAQICDILDSVL